MGATSCAISPRARYAKISEALLWSGYAVLIALGVGCLGWLCACPCCASEPNGPRGLSRVFSKRNSRRGIEPVEEPKPTPAATPAVGKPVGEQVNIRCTQCQQAFAAPSGVKVVACAFCGAKQRVPERAA